MTNMVREIGKKIKNMQNEIGVHILLQISNVDTF